MSDSKSDSLSSTLKKFQEDLLKRSYKSSLIDKEVETIDIINNYAWINDKAINNSETTSNKVPFCYVIERKSAANAGIANVLNMLNAAQQNIGKIADATSSITNLFATDSDISEAVKEGSGKVKTVAEGLVSTMIKGLLSEKAQKLVAKNNLSVSSVLAPYKYLYITEETGKNYRFPLANASGSFTPLKNNWGNSDKLPGFLQKALDTGFNAMDAVSAYTNFGTNILDFQNGGGDIGNFREMAKSFTYPQNGDGVTVNFTLYNTTKLNAWKENYKFLFLFYLRNLPMRIDFASFVPPLLYDVLVPGIKQLPVCCVEGLNIVPRGMTRVLTCENFLAGNNKNDKSMVVNVPEAWEVTINFRSLIANSMNLMIEGVYGGYKISTETSNFDVDLSVD